MSVKIKDYQNDQLYVGECDLGLGIFAKSDMKIRQVCGYLCGELIEFEQTQTAEGGNSVQVGPGLYIFPTFPMKFANHSCEPNVGLADDLSLITLAPIKKNEELRFDYSTTIYERYYTMSCKCGKENCRGEIGDFDLLPANLQSKYIELGIVQAFIQERVLSENTNRLDQTGLLGALQSECNRSGGLDRVKGSISAKVLH